MQMAMQDSYSIRLSKSDVYIANSYFHTKKLVADCTSHICILQCPGVQLDFMDITF